MPRIHCHYLDCVFLDDGYCSAAAVEIDPDAGCMTYNPTSEPEGEDQWDEEEELEEWDEVAIDDEEEEELWMDEEEDEY